MKLDQAGRDFIMKHEGDIPYEYYCQAKVPTIGIGVTIKNLTPEELGKLKCIPLSELKQIKNVPPVIFNGEVRTIDKVTIESIFTRMVTTFEKAVNKHVKVPITQNQFNALVSFAYNVGIGNAKKGFRSSSLLKNINKGQANNTEVITWCFNQWTKAGGKIGGLAKRRKQETNFYFKEA